jgi:hypothetical protein
MKKGVLTMQMAYTFNPLSRLSRKAGFWHLRNSSHKIGQVRVKSAEQVADLEHKLLLV